MCVMCKIEICWATRGTSFVIFFKMQKAKFYFILFLKDQDGVRKVMVILQEAANATLPKVIFKNF